MKRWKVMYRKIESSAIMPEIYCYSSMEGIVTSMTSDLQCGLLSPHDSEMRGDKFSQGSHKIHTKYLQSEPK